MIYIAAPYTKVSVGQQFDVVQWAKRVEVVLADAGLLAYNPLRYSEHFEHVVSNASLNGAPLASDDSKSYLANDPGFRNYWYAHGLRVLSACDLIVVIKWTGWNSSEGVNKEVWQALKQGAIVYPFDPAEEGADVALIETARKVCADLLKWEY